MDKNEFTEKIAQGVQQLSIEQVIHFEWVCAVRALPFLGCKGNFSFWFGNDRQKHIYSVFNALDRSVDFLTVVRADVRAAADGHRINSLHFQSLLLNDLENIKNSQQVAGTPDDLYGAIWDNFHHALEVEGCSYWSRLYKDIFRNRFVLDKDALQTRLNVPKEIQNQGAAAVATYLEELEKGAVRLTEARIIILGEKGAGKTCLARKLVNPEAPMTTDNESTAGVDITLWKLKDEKINAHIWDFAGHTVTHAVHQFFLSERCVYIMVYDGRTEERNRLEYWLNHVKNFGGDSKAFILVNKRDNHRIEILVFSHPCAPHVRSRENSPTRPDSYRSQPATG